MLCVLKNVIRKYVCENSAYIWCNVSEQDMQMLNRMKFNELLSCSLKLWLVKKGKVFPYLLPSVGPGADASVQAVSPQVT